MRETLKEGEKIVTLNTMTNLYIAKQNKNSLFYCTC